MLIDVFVLYTFIYLYLLFYLYLNFINTPTDPHHCHHHPALTHRHKKWLPSKQAGLFSSPSSSSFFSKTHSVQFMYLNRHLSGLSEFLKTNRFSWCPFCFIVRLYLFLFMYKKLFLSVQQFKIKI